METNLKSNRNLGIDALRALAMFFVICQHILGQGGVVAGAEGSPLKHFFLCFLQILAYCAVDVYGITTGYLMCRKPFRLSRLTKLWLTTVFWSVAVSCVFFAIVPESRTISEAVSMFLPILRGRYWFFTAYFVTMLVSPVLNHIIQTLSRRQFKLLLAVLFLIFGVIPVASLGYDVLRISGGNHFSWMIALYLIGGYLRVHGLPERRPCIYLGGYFLLSFAQLAYQFGMRAVGLGAWSGLFLTCVSPLVVGEAVCLFQCFKAMGTKLSAESFLGKLIQFGTPGVYAVYVIHVHPLIFWNKDLIAAFRPWDSWNGLQAFGAVIVTALGVFVLCILLDAVRQRLFRVLRIDRTADRLSDWAEQKIRTLLN